MARKTATQRLEAKSRERKGEGERNPSREWAKNMFAFNLYFYATANNYHVQRDAIWTMQQVSLYMQRAFSYSEDVNHARNSLGINSGNVGYEIEKEYAISWI